MARNQNRNNDPTLKELRAIKNLLVVLLVKLGATSDEIDCALGMGASNIRAAFPMKKIKQARVKVEEE